MNIGKLIILALILYVLALISYTIYHISVDNKQLRKQPQKLPIVQETLNKHEIDYAEIIVFDSCEYIKYRVHTANAITHKGNCKFCKQRK